MLHSPKYASTSLFCKIRSPSTSMLSNRIHSRGWESSSHLLVDIASENGPHTHCRAFTLDPQAVLHTFDIPVSSLPPCLALGVCYSSVLGKLVCFEFLLGTDRRPGRNQDQGSSLPPRQPAHAVLHWRSGAAASDRMAASRPACTGDGRRCPPRRRRATRPCRCLAARVASPSTHSNTKQQTRTLHAIACRILIRRNRRNAAAGSHRPTPSDSGPDVRPD